MKKPALIVVVLFLKITTASSQNGLVAYYPFTGNAIDATGHGNNGTVIGATLTSDRFGNPNSAYHFDGISNYINIPNNTFITDSLNGSQHLTITAWVKSDALITGLYAIFNQWKHNPVPGPVGIEFSIFDQRIAAAAIYGQYTASTPTILTSNQWYFVALVYDGTISNPSQRYWWFINCNKYYTDCSYPNTYCNSFPSLLGTQADETLIGAASNSTSIAHYYFHGSIDELRIYNRTLADTDISAICVSCYVPVVNLGNDSSNCNGNPITLDAGNSGSFFNWYLNGTLLPNDTSQAYQAQQSGTFTAVVDNGTCVGMDSVNIQIQNLSSVTLSSNSPICGGDTLLLSSTYIANAFYHWSGPNGFQSTLQNPVITNFNLADTGFYSLMIQLNGCSSTPDSVNISGSTLPNISVSSNSPLCAGDTLLLSSTFIASASYQWNGPNGFQSTLQNPVITNFSVADTGSYSLAIQLNGCSGTPDSVHVSESIHQNILVSSNAPLCIGDTLLLSSTFIANASYQWNGPNGFQSTLQNPVITNFSVSDTGFYSLVIQLNGCYSTPDSVNVIGSLTQNISVFSNSPSCTGDTLLLSSTFIANASYQWNGPNGFQSTLQNPVIQNFSVADTGSYSLIVQLNGCNSPSVSTLVLPPFVFQNISTSSNSPLCIGDTLFLTSNFIGGATYHWLGPNGFQSTLQNPVLTNVNSSDTGVYSLVISANGCSSSPNFIHININSFAFPLTITTDSVVCDQDTIQIFATYVAGAQYSWTGPNSFASSQQNPQILNITSANTGMYSLIVTPQIGCRSGVFSTHISVIQRPSDFISGDHSICEGEALRLQSTNSYLYNYQWTGPSNLSSSNNEIDISPIFSFQSGIYILTASSACGIVTDSFELEVIPSSANTFLPNVFTPNNDSKNDFYIIDSTEDFEMKVFNRWGEEIIDLTSSKRIWDGTFKGSQVPDGVYAYVFKGHNCKGELISRRGTIMVIR